MRPVTTPEPAADLTPIEDLERDIHNLCIGINAATSELLTLIREFDERAGWLKWGLDNCSEWLAWRCDLSVATAREKVRVAHALKILPLMTESFSTGELSYSKVRELTRVATPQNEDELVAFALRHTTAHVAERCRELRMGSVASGDVAERAFAKRSLRIRRDAERAMMVVNIELPLEAGELIEKALDKARNDEGLAHPDIVDTTWSKRQADAFVTLLKEYLEGSNKDTNGHADSYLVNIHVDHAALAGEDGRSSLPIESVKRLCCDASAVVITEDKGQPLSVGRKTRVVPKAIERAVRSRDNQCCVFPGCRNRRFLDCHHVEHWSNGGETSADNLMLLCTRHHTLVHEGGFRIDKDFNDRWIFVRPDGVAVPAIGYRTRDMVDADIGGVSGEDYDPPRGGLLSIAERYALEPSPPDYIH
jgi:hypothetical protein